MKHTKDVQCWAEWWILWRRVAAGLSRPHHDEIYRRLAPFLLPVKGTSAAKKAGRAKPEAHELNEMWRCAAALEQLTPAIKEALGESLLKEPANSALAVSALWCVGRLGARVLLFGPANAVVPKQTAERWTETLLGREFVSSREKSDAIFALAQLARVAGDRARDLDDALRQCVLKRLAALGAVESVLRPVREFHELEQAQQVQAFGDTLPIGLRLLGAASSGSAD